MQRFARTSRAGRSSWAWKTGKPSTRLLETLVGVWRRMTVRRSCASTSPRQLQRLPVDERWDVVEALLAHAEDADDHNLPLMYWYAAEPLAGEDARPGARPGRRQAKVPLLLPFMARRIAATATPEAIELLVQTCWPRSSDADRQLRRPARHAAKG